MPLKSGGAQNLRPGDKVRIDLNSCYRHFLNGLTGTVTQTLSHSAIVALDNDPAFVLQRVIGPGGSVGPRVPNLPQRGFQYHELVKI